MKITINLSNGWLYALIAIGILAIIGVGVYAFIGEGGVGHDLSEIQPCAAGKILQTNVGGTAWECVDMPGEATDTRCDTSETCSQVCIGTDCQTSWPTGTSGSLSCVTETCIVDGAACTATCPSGYLITGGGNKFTGSSSFNAYSYPSGNGWYCPYTYAYNNQYCYARCCKVV